MTGIIKISLKTFLECVRLRTFGRYGLQQIQVDCHYLQMYLWRFVSDENLVHFLLDEIVGSCAHRCLDPAPMEQSVIEVICERGWGSALKFRHPILAFFFFFEMILSTSCAQKLLREISWSIVNTLDCEWLFISRMLPLKCRHFGFACLFHAMYLTLKSRKCFLLNFKSMDKIVLWLY